MIWTVQDHQRPMGPAFPSWYEKSGQEPVKTAVAKQGRPPLQPNVCRAVISTFRLKRIVMYFYILDQTDFSFF